MKEKIIFILMSLFFIPYSAYAIDDAIQKKYPFAKLTNDYGILNENDLNDRLKPEPFSTKELTGHIYWQCFPREDVSTTIEDIGHSTHDLDDNDADLNITAYSKPGVIHKYVMRHNWATPGTEKRFNQLIKIMKGEKYVCLSGEFRFLEERIISGQKQLVYYWTSEKIKTKKGCNSYFEPVNCS